MPKSIIELKNEIVELKQKYNPKADYVFPAEFDLAFIAAELEFTKKNIFSGKEKVLIQEYRLALINKYYELLCERSKIPATPPVNRVVSTPAYSGYYTSLFSGLFVNLLHGYLGSRALLELIASTTNPIMFTINIVMTVLNGFSYYLYEGYVLKKNLGIPLLDSNAEYYLSLFESQTSLTTKINEKIFHYNTVNELPEKDYKAFAEVAKQINQIAINNKSIFENYKESTANAVARNSIIGFGAIMAAGSGAFAVKAFLTLISASLLTTWVGLALMGLCALSSVVFFMGQRPHKVYKMMNPLAVKYKMIQEQYEFFRPKVTADFDNVNLKKEAENNIIPFQVHRPAPVDKRTRNGLFNRSVIVNKTGRSLSLDSAIGQNDLLRYNSSRAP